MDEQRMAIAYTLRRSRRRRRTVELSIDPALGLIVAAPAKTPLSEIDGFLRRKARWIRKALENEREREQHLRRDLTSGEFLPYLGRAFTLSLVEAEPAGERAVLVRTCLEVSLAAGSSGEERRSATIEALEAWYKAQARATFLERVQCFVPLVGARAKDVRVRDQKTRWGSCGKDGTLYFSWQLIMAPPSVVDYLVVHELCHLRQPGHGHAFWALVAGVLPDYQQQRAALRRDGWRYRLS
ncbi:MAG: SprT family zinc-dependent metalloprotease [Dehalococcoidia bacterium]|nr:SprT family zinc-dependent metalloprotease [Dehalococcoidia bacterium]